MSDLLARIVCRAQGFDPESSVHLEAAKAAVPDLLRELTPATTDVLEAALGDLLRQFANAHGLETDDTGRAGFNETHIVFPGNEPCAMVVTTCVVFQDEDGNWGI